MKRLFYISILFLSVFVTGQRTVAQLETDWQTAYNGVRQQMLAYSNDNTSSDGNFQGHYYMYWPFQSLLEAWQATGRTDLLTDLQTVITNLENSSTTTSGGYDGWPALGNTNAPDGAVLFEGYGFRPVFQFLRIMHQSPNLKTANLAWFNARMAFWVPAFWDKWDTRGALYRENAYMTSHAARIAMDLHIITNEQKYLDFFNNFNFDGVPSGNKGTGSYLRKYFGANPAVSGGIDFSDHNWESNGTFQSGVTVDWDHFDDILNLMAIAREEEYYWNTQVSVFDGLALSYQDDLNPTTLDLHFFVNQTGNDDNYSASQGPTHFGRFDQTFQVFLENALTLSKMNTAVTPVKEFPLGILLNNRKILEDGKPVYPENYTPFGGPPLVALQLRINSNQSVMMH